MSDDVTHNVPVAIPFLDNGQRAVPEELWKLFPEYSTLESRALAERVLACLRECKPKEYQRLTRWADAHPAYRSGETNQQDKVFAALCKAASSMRRTPAEVVALITKAKSSVGYLMKAEAYLP